MHEETEALKSKIPAKVMQPKGRVEFDRGKSIPQVQSPCFPSLPSSCYVHWDTHTLFPSTAAVGHRWVNVYVYL